VNIHVPLLSILSLAVLLSFSFCGDVELYTLDIGFSTAASGQLTVTVDPVWAVWVPQSVVYTRGCNAFAYGNVMVLDETRRGNLYGDYLLAHESNHVEQYRALGLLTWPAQLILDIEPPGGTIQDWNDPTQPDRVMWLPPPSWTPLWHFLTLSL